MRKLFLFGIFLFFIFLVRVNAGSCFVPFITNPGSSQVLWVGACQANEPTDDQLNPADRTYAIEYTNCICEPEEGHSQYTSCFHDEKIWKSVNGMRAVTSVVTNLAGNPELCRLCAINRTITGGSSEPIICAFNPAPQRNPNDPDPLFPCQQGKIYVGIQQGLLWQCGFITTLPFPDPWTGFDRVCMATHVSEIDDIYPPGSKLEHIEPCCQDQDGDHHGIEEYHLDPVFCGSIANGDCNDDEVGLWRGCQRGSVSMEFGLSKEYKDKLTENFVDYSTDPVVGKPEKCEQTTDWNADGWLPSQTTYCPNTNVQTHTSADEYPLKNTDNTNPQMIWEGAEVECNFKSTTEPTRWGSLSLPLQKVHIEIQKRTKPSAQWQIVKGTDLPVTQTPDCKLELRPGESLPEGQSMTEYAILNSLDATCKAKFQITEDLRGSEIRCFAHPWNDEINNYWKSLGIASKKMVVAHHSIVLFPTDIFVQKIKVGFAGFIQDNNAQGAIVIGNTEISSNIRIQHNRLSQNIHEETLLYLNQISDANSALKWSTKPVYFEQQLDSRRMEVAVEITAASKVRHPRNIIAETPQGQQSVVEEVHAPITLNGKRKIVEGSDERAEREIELRSILNFIDGLDVIFLEHSPILFDLPQVDQSLIKSFDYSYEGRTVNYKIDLEGAKIISEGTHATSTINFAEGRGSFSVIQENSPLTSLSHEFGHLLQGLCDEYQATVWVKNYINFRDAGGVTCRNVFPLCCMGAGPQQLSDGRTIIASGVVQNGCVNEQGLCKGAPYYSDENGHDVPDPLGTHPAEWQWRSIMGGNRDDNNVIYPTVGTTGYQNTNICELRAWPDKPNGDRICQQK